MKPRPTKIQPGATHWNPNAGPDWYTNKCCSDGGWMYFDAEEGNWDQGTWRWSERVSTLVLVRDLIPVEHLMAQHNGANSLSAETTQAVSENYTARLKREIEWNGEGLPPVGTVCEWNGLQVTVIGFHDDFVVCRFPDDVKPLYDGVFAAALRPIKSERDKAIDEMEAIVKNVDYQAYRSKKIATALYDAGCRKVEK